MHPSRLAFDNCSYSFKEAVMICQSYREFCQGRRKSEISMTQEIVGTVIFTAGTVCLILIVLAAFSR
jgi:hypothetical protein